MVDNLARKLDVNDFAASKLEMNEIPVKWCSVSLSEMVNRGKRLEASVFDVEAKQAWEIINANKFGCVPLYSKDGLIETAYYPGKFKRTNSFCHRN